MSLVLIAFVMERRRPEIIFSFMYTILPTDDGQSNRPKHMTEIQ
jgi:hypothetical protein